MLCQEDGISGKLVCRKDCLSGGWYIVSMVYHEVGISGGWYIGRIVCQDDSMLGGWYVGRWVC